MKDRLRASLDSVLEQLRASGRLEIDAVPDYQIEVPKQAAHGDLSTNLAMLLAKPCRRPPREIAAMIADALGKLDVAETIDVAGPGFINFVIRDAVVFGVLERVAEEGATYGHSRTGAGRRVQVEFVSANPTGPLHIGHGRGAAFGSVLANLLDACGFEVSREYYVNDAGRQMDILALSVWLRYLQACGRRIDLPSQAYQGEYVGHIAADVRLHHGDAFLEDFPAVPAAGAESASEKQLDMAIDAAKAVLGGERYGTLRTLAKDAILSEIRADLEKFGVEFDVWYSESSLEVGRVDAAITALSSGGHIFDDGGAQWFRSSAFGDEKDRVVVRENGAKTYFASDIAYHLDKFERGFHTVIDVWGSDHHGYITRVKAALEALAVDPARLEVLLVQFATLVRGGEKVAMSTRAGEFVTLKELVDEVGVDAARFFYVMRRSDQHLEFDLDLAKAQSNENPVYYVQYAHARICSVLRQLAERNLQAGPSPATAGAALIEAPERTLAVLLSRFPETVEATCLAREPHQLISFLRDLATEFHAYYNAHKVLVDDPRLRGARIALVTGVRQVLANGLALLGIRAPQEM